jgi:hypothetical protein
MFFWRALMAAAVLAFAAFVVIPFVGPGEANVVEIIRAAERHYVAAARVYELRVTLWGGPLGRHMLSGEVQFRPGPPPVSEGFLTGGRDESGQPVWGVTFGRDENGAWVQGSKGVRRSRPIVRQNPRDDDGPLPPQDLEAMTLEAVLPHLRSGYDLELLGTPSMRTIIAKRREGVRSGPQRVDIELARDGRTIERAKIEVTRSAASTIVELRLRAPLGDGAGTAPSV